MIRLPLLLTLCFATPLVAQELPALYDVTGVASDDTLNIRSEPGAAGDVLATLAPDAANIEVVMESGGWGLVNTGETSGWVSLHYMARHDGPASLVPTQCVGTEPFWSLSPSGDTAIFSTPDGPDRFYDTVTAQPFLARADRIAMSGHLGDQVFTASIRREICSDGMSDRSFGLAVDLIFTSYTGTTGYSGCCTIQP